MSLAISSSEQFQWNLWRNLMESDISDAMESHGNVPKSCRISADLESRTQNQVVADPTLTPCNIFQHCILLS